jgi:LmbE family N-acetylglucosaminyl deacetylase
MKTKAGLSIILAVTAALTMFSANAEDKKLRIVIFGAHCDDPETGVGGLASKLSKAGHEVIMAYAATFRDDRKINEEPEDAVRRRESTEASAILGAKPYFFPFNMSTLTNDAVTAKEFSDWLNGMHPDIVITHWPMDTHPNHQVVGALTWQAYRHEGGWSLYYFEVLTDTQSLSFKPDVYVDITDAVDIKKQAVDRLVSQDPNELWTLHDAMQRMRGKECGCERAEAFYLAEKKPGAALLPIPVKKPLQSAPGIRRKTENLDRGLTATPLDGNQVYLSWRLFTGDFPELTFNIYRSIDGGPGEKLNPEPVSKTTDFIDASAMVDKDKTYWLEPLLYKMPQGVSNKALVKAGETPRHYTSIKLQGDYTCSKAGIGDLDGDGGYDFVFKQPGSIADPGNSYWVRSKETFKLEAYLQNGSFLWKKDLGWSIEQGVWYSPYVVYDFDGDGKAEIAVKTGEGDPRGEDGRVRESKEYLSILNGMTGEEITKTPWIPRLDIYKLSSRNQLGVAYLDGKTPSVMMARGTYEEMHLRAYSYHDGALELQWEWSNVNEPKEYWGQGAHFMHCVDLDDDGRDEVVLGSCVIDDNGKSLWSTGFGHSDHAYVGEIDPNHPGLEIYYGVEGERVRREKNGACLVDAKTGSILWALNEPTWHIHSHGMCADIDSRYPGLECYSGESEEPKDKPHRWLHAADGQLLVREDAFDVGVSTDVAYWDADSQRELFNGNRVYKYETSATCSEPVEGEPVAIADIFGDWREEIITALAGEIRIYATTIPAVDRHPSLMQDPLYRQDVAHLSMGYAQPPMLSYWLVGK